MRKARVAFYQKVCRELRPSQMGLYSRKVDSMVVLTNLGMVRRTMETRATIRGEETSNIGRMPLPISPRLTKMTTLIPSGTISTLRSKLETSLDVKSLTKSS